MKSTISIPLHADLMNHPKFLRFCSSLRRIGEDERLLLRAQLENLWLWAAEYYPDGHIDGHVPETISTVCCWQGEPDLWLRALVGSEFLIPTDTGFQIANWDQYAGKAHKKKQQATLRKQRSRQNQSQSQNESTPQQEILLPENTIPDNTTVNEPQHTINQRDNQIDESKHITSRGHPRDISNRFDRDYLQNIAIILHLLKGISNKRKCIDSTTKYRNKLKRKKPRVAFNQRR
jgi:hypothetical protein